MAFKGFLLVGILCLLFTAGFLAQDVSAQFCGNGLCETSPDGRSDETPDSCPQDCAQPGPVCGDGIIDPGEDCDTLDLGGTSCTELGGFTGGSLSCDAFCNFDLNACNAAFCGDGFCTQGDFDSCPQDCPATCGNNVIEETEVCDGTNFGGSTCADFGFDQPIQGDLTCSFSNDGPCSQIDISSCSPLCGNSVLDQGETCELLLGVPTVANCRISTFCTFCGDSNLDFQEECDDGNNFNGDGCSELCLIEPFCGDDIITEPEQCDGGNLNGRTCQSLGFDVGTLSCSFPSCIFDTSQCTGAGPTCGDNVAVGTEACDGTDLLGQTCIDLGFIGGSLSCNGSCELNTSACTPPAPFCGDGAATGLEECDGADLLGKTCMSEGFNFGDLSCLEFCVLDTIDCRSDIDFCTDGTINPPEQCELNDLNGQTCSSLGFDGGNLACSTTSAADCKFDTRDCTGTGPFCGDGFAVGGERCDGADLLGQTCIRLGFDGGTLGCTTSCGYDTTACTVSSVCGNGIAEAGGGEPGDEACDGNDLMGQTCAGLGFDGGPLGCTASCAFDTNACTGAGPECGDGVVNGAEQCDGVNVNDRTCQSLGFDGGTLSCSTSSCKFDTGMCTGTGPICGDGFVQAGVEQCDPPSAGTCDASCQFISSSSGTVIGTTTVTQFCGGVQLDENVNPPNFNPVEQAISFPETVNNQPSDQRTLRIANTGSGAARVAVDVVPATGLPGNDGETSPWEDLNFVDLFDRCNTRWSSVDGTLYAGMNSICPTLPKPLFIDVLPSQTTPPTSFVDRFMRTLPEASDADFNRLGDPLTASQALRLEISCIPNVATCQGGATPVNGECP